MWMFGSNWQTLTEAYLWAWIIQDYTREWITEKNLGTWGILLFPLIAFGP